MSHPHELVFPQDILSHDEGLTLRDYFAAVALPAILADAMRYNAERSALDGIGFDEIAAKAYIAAGAMIEERSK